MRVDDALKRSGSEDTTCVHTCVHTSHPHAAHSRTQPHTAMYHVTSGHGRSCKPPTLARAAPHANSTRSDCLAYPSLTYTLCEHSVHTSHPHPTATCIDTPAWPSHGPPCMTERDSAQHSADGDLLYLVQRSHAAVDSMCCQPVVHTASASCKRPSPSTPSSSPCTHTWCT